MANQARIEIEQKNIIDWIVKKLVNVVNLEPFRQRISNFISGEYHKGIESSEIQFNMNFIPSDKDVNFLNDYVNNNMKQHTDAIGESLRGELSRGMINKENVKQLKKRIRDVFKDKKFANRLKTVLRTEQIRANNFGSLEGARQTGLKLKKYVSVILDGVTSDICKGEHRKYGSKEQSIGLDKDFIVRVRNTTVRAQSPPFHPNCRTVVRFVKEEDIKR